VTVVEALCSWEQSRSKSRMTPRTVSVMKLARSASKRRSSVRPTRSSLSAAASLADNPSRVGW
jgi:hypothetical protein